MRFLLTKCCKFPIIHLLLNLHAILLKIGIVVVVYKNNLIMKEILSKKEVEHFIQKGYVRIEEAFPKQMVDEV